MLHLRMSLFAIYKPLDKNNVFLMFYIRIAK